MYRMFERRQISQKNIPKNKGNEAMKIQNA